MNCVFKPLLRKCVLVFFDDILVYSPSLSLHWHDLEAVFQLMQHHLFAKPSKCAFATSRVEYLGHFISAQEAFEALKKALVIAPVLGVPDFSKIFILETDASNEGIGAVLTFVSRTLGPKWQKLSVYEKELLAIVFAVQKWEQYLIGQKFVIHTDQKSLKWLLQQKISTPFQKFWCSKLMGFDYEIFYKSGKENLVADALSCVWH